MAASSQALADKLLLGPKKPEALSEKEKDKKKAKELESSSQQGTGHSEAAAPETLAERIARARNEYQTYAASQAEIQLPVAEISIEQPDKGPGKESDSSDRKAHKERATVHMDVSYQKAKYHFESVTEDEVGDIYTYLNSQPLVRGKYAHGKIVSVEDTQARVKQLSARFEAPRDQPLCLQGGFVVSDAETTEFLGFCNLGGSGKDDGHSEMAFLNRADAWSAVVRDPEIVKGYAIPKKCRLSRQYQGLATVEVSTLLQYSAQLKKGGYKIGGKDLEGVNATARLDNPGSWKACAKSGMEVTDIDSNPSYGPELRYQLRKGLK